MCHCRVCIPWIHIGPQKIIVEGRRFQLAIHDRIDLSNSTAALDIIKPHYYDSLSSTVYPDGAKTNTTKEEALG